MLQLTARPMAGDNYRQPYAEDCPSDDGQSNNANNGVPIDALSSDASPGKANVRTKRSNPEHLGTEKTPTDRAPAFDVKSDSGYSSHSVAGMSSADSAASAPSSQRSPPVNTVPPVVPSPTPAERAPRPTHQRQQSSQSAQSAQGPPRLSRRDSQRRPTNERRPAISQAQPKRRDSTRNDDCTVPGCTQCGPDAIDRSRPRPSRRASMLQHPAESAPDVSHRHHHDTRSQVSDPAPYYPPSPITDSRPPRQYQQGAHVVQPAVTRRPSVTSRSARPTSYHGDPRDAYRPQPSMHQPSMHQERGPPLSMSATFGYPQQQPQHPMNSGYMAQPYAAPNPYFAQVQQMLPTQSYERPHLSARAPSMPTNAPRVVPVVMQPGGSHDRPISARYPSYTPAPVFPPTRQIRQDEDDDSLSDSEDDSEEESEEEVPLRPVRRIKDAPEAAAPRRPSMHRAPNTTPVLDRPHRKPRPQTVVVDRPRRADPERERVRADRRKSVSRPPLVPHVKAQSEYPTPRGQIIVESPRSDRRPSRQEYNMSYDGRERISRREYNPDQKRQNRSSRVYDTGRDYEREWDVDDYENEEVVRAPLSTRNRRGTNTDTRPRTQRPVVEVNRKVNAAENYISADRGARETYADQAYEVARKRSSRVSGGPSEAESSRSRGSDNTNGEIRLRIGNDAPVTFSLKGDMEGRTVQLVPGGNGMNELVISGNSRGETTYRNEKGSLRRAITSASQAGRDAEDRTDRSSQSSRRRQETRGEHDDPRRVHHRQMRRRERAETEYH